MSGESKHLTVSSELLSTARKLAKLAAYLAALSFVLVFVGLIASLASLCTILDYLNRVAEPCLKAVNTTVPPNVQKAAIALPITWIAIVIGGILAGAAASKALEASMNIKAVQRSIRAAIEEE